LIMESLSIAVAGLVVVLGLMAIGMPIGCAMLAVGFGGIMVLGSFEQALNALVSHSYYAISSYVFVVLPLFILMGHWALYGGLSRNLYDFTHKWLGHLPGGLALATVAGCGGFGAVTGSSLATAATMGKVAIPEMERFGYDSKLSSGVVAASGTLGILIPPSGIGIIYAYITGLSVAKVLMAGLLPGILSAVIYGIMIIVRVSKKPELGPPAIRIPWRERLASIKGLSGVLLLVVVVLGGIYSGLVTVTEAGAVGTFLCLIIAIISKGMSWPRLKTSLTETAETAAMIFLIIVGATLFTLFVALSGLPSYLSNWLVALPLPPLATLLLILVAYIPMGMFLDTIATILLTVPIVFPTLLALGYDGVWFGVILIKTAELALITPPIGMNVYVVRSIAPHIQLQNIFLGIMPFALMDIVTIAILVAFPQISLWLPSTMG
jgi:C4-dicarboxylate transporter DctM subunit